MSVLEISPSNGSTHSASGGSSVSRTFLVPWAGRLAFAAGLTGQPHPEIPFCWCHSVKVEPALGENTRTPIIAYYPAPIQYDFAKVTADYAVDWPQAALWPSAIPKPSIRANTAIELRTQSSTEILRFPARQMRWEDNSEGYPDSPVPQEDSEAGRLLIRQTEYELIWHYVDDPPVGRLDESGGAVNAAPFLGCATETLLFVGYAMEAATKFDLFAPGSWKLNLTFQRRAIRMGEQVFGWNHEYRGEDGWHRVEMHDGTGWVDRYPKLSFAGLLL